MLRVNVKYFVKSLKVIRNGILEKGVKSVSLRTPDVQQLSMPKPDWSKMAMFAPVDHVTLSRVITDIVNVSVKVSAKLRFAGEYGIHVKLNDEHVPESPAMLYIAPESGDAKKITLVGLRDRGLEVSK